jgi:hypothetical protein
MGLDQYVFIKPKSGEPDELCEEFFYWRKHADLQGWMQSLYYEKGGDEKEFNQVDLDLTMDDINRLERDYQNLNHHTGFFYGASDHYDTDQTTRFIAKAKAALSQGRELFYTSWW